MFNNFNSIEIENKMQSILKYGKMGVLVLIPIIVILMILFKGHTSSNSQYNTLEQELINNAKTLDVSNKVADGESIYLDLYTLETETAIGTLEDSNGYVCDKSSGVLISKNNNKMTYIPYLICGNYKSLSFPNNKTNNYITLKGASNVIVSANDDYIEPGYTTSGDINVEVVGTVLQIPGLYTLEYRATKNNNTVATVKRTVIVTDSDVLISQQDQNTLNSTSSDAKTPIINLKGDNIININVGDSYIEPGYTAIDKKDGDITDKVQVLGTVDTNKARSYTLTYQIRNSLGYQSSKQRTVIVAPQATNLNILSNISPSSGTKGPVTITLNITGNGYDYTILPNGNKNYNQNISYTANNNGSYNFYVYDKNNNVNTKQIIINNIDNNAPLVVCSAIYENNKTTIKVNNLGSETITYSYSINNNFSTYTSQSTYSINQKGTVALVKAKDSVGNIRYITCPVEDKTVTTTNPTPTGGACDLSYIKVNVDSCFNRDVLETLSFPDYLKGVVYGEESIGRSNDEQFLKAFIIFARTYSFFRSDLENNTLSIRSCSSDQNYCNLSQGCYRYQTQDMFNSCMDFSMRKSGYYTPQQCANRVTTYAGSNRSINLNTTYTVSSEITSNHNWNSSWPTRVQGTHNTKQWKSPIPSKELNELNRLITETDGIVVYDKNGKLANIHYIGECSYSSHGNQMCTDSAYKMSQQGKSYQDIISAYTKDYPNYKLACYHGKTIAN